MPLDEIIKIAEKRKIKEIKTAKPNPSNPPKKTLFDSRQLER